MNINKSQFNELSRYAEVGRLSASLLHEISNPLSAAIIQLEMSDQNSLAVRRARRNMQTICCYIEAARLQIISNSPSIFFSLNSQFAVLKQSLIPLAKKAGVNLEFNLGKASNRLHGDPIKFQQIVSNLIVNAIQAYDGCTTINVKRLVKINLVSSKSKLSIEVRDWGKGISDSQKLKLFEPFYTTKSDTYYGLGIGLSIAKQYITQDFNGSIKVRSTPYAGTVFTMKLPSNQHNGRLKVS